jgi:hypothetical protein
MWQHSPGGLLFLQPPPCSKVGSVKVDLCVVAAETVSIGAARIIATRMDAIFFHER